MYEEKKFSLSGLKGLSDRQIAEHLKLYSGYVKNVNALIETPDLKRFAFEWNGMRLHELYFEQLSATPRPSTGALSPALIDEVKKVGLTRGAGWALLVRDPRTQKDFVTWVADHEVGHLAGLPVMLALDAWEHAFLLDYLPSQRKEYIEAFFQNLDWSVVEKRIHGAE